MTGAESVNRFLYYASSASLIALILLCVAWELWLGPQRPGGSWLVLKALPLLAPLRGVLHEKVYTFRWASLLILAYFVEGVVRAYAEAGNAGTLAQAEVALSLLFFVCALAYVRARSARRRPTTDGRSTESGK